MGTQFSPKGGTVPQFSAHVYCGQTTGCIKMPLVKEVGVGPGQTGCAASLFRLDKLPYTVDINGFP